MNAFESTSDREKLNASTFRYAEVEVREREFSVTNAGEAQPVEPKAFRGLLILLRNPQKLITKEEKLQQSGSDAPELRHRRCLLSHGGP